MFLTILAGLAATFAYFRIGHWVGTRSLDVWYNRNGAREKTWLCWVLFPFTARTGRIGSSPALIVDFDREGTTYRRTLLFVWPLKALFNSVAFFALLCGAFVVGVKDVLFFDIVPGFCRGLNVIAIVADRLFISGPDKLAAGIKKLTRSRTQLRQLKEGKKAFATSAAAISDTLKKAE